LNAIDNEEVDKDEDIFIVKRTFFTEQKNRAIEDFANTWFVDKDELHLSQVQYMIGMDPIPNIGEIIDSRDFDKYKAVNPDAKPFKYGPEMKRQWRKVLDEVVVPLDDEVRYRGEELKRLIDFDKRKGNNSVNTALNPRELFDILPEKDDKDEDYL